MRLYLYPVIAAPFFSRSSSQLWLDMQWTVSVIMPVWNLNTHQR